MPQTLKSAIKRDSKFPSACFQHKQKEMKLRTNFKND